jgi:hypothetical protein
MARDTYAGAWKRATLPRSLVPGKPPIDREHSAPSDAPDPTYVLSYVDTTGAPLLPDEWTGGQYVQEPVGSAFTDQTPVTHDDGRGFLPGVDQPEAQRIGGYARSIDLGAPDVRDWERPRYQGDGSGHVEIRNPDLDGESPATLKYLEKGVGVDIDPYARTNRAIRRRPTGPATYDNRDWTPGMRPKYQPNRHGSIPARGPVANRQNNISPEGAGAILRPDNWAAPVVRRVAASWDQAFVTDGTPAPAGDFGLGSWGL